MTAQLEVQAHVAPEVESLPGRNLWTHLRESRAWTRKHWGVPTGTVVLAVAGHFLNLALDLRELTGASSWRALAVVVLIWIASYVIWLVARSPRWPRRRIIVAIHGASVAVPVPAAALIALIPILWATGDNIGGQQRAESINPRASVQDSPAADDPLRLAIVQRERGDLAEAYRLLEHYIDSADSIEYDVAEFYANQLAGRVGDSGALKRLKQLADDGKHPALAIQHARLHVDKATRLALHEAVVAEYPDYGPGYYALANQQLFAGTIAGRSGAAANFRRFLESTGNERYFYDAMQLQNARTQARVNGEALGATQETEKAYLPQVNVQLQPNLRFVSVSGKVLLGERSTEQKISIDGRPAQNAPRGRDGEFVVPLTAREISVEYRDAAGSWQGPFRKAVDPVRVLREDAENLSRSSLDVRPWVDLTVWRSPVFPGANNRPKVSVSGGFTLMRQDFFVVKRVHFGYNRKIPDQSVEVGVTDAQIRGGKVDLDSHQRRLPRNFPPDLQSLSVQLEYFDGTKSEVRVYDIKNRA